MANEDTANTQQINPELLAYLKEQFQQTQFAINVCTKLGADMEWLFRQLSQATLKPFAEGIIVALRLNPEQAETVRIAATASLIDLSAENYKQFIEAYIQNLEKQQQQQQDEQAKQKADANLAVARAQGVTFE